MRGIVKGTGIVACVAGMLLIVALGGYCATILSDGFEPATGDSLWTIGPDSWKQSSGHHMLEGQANHIRTPGVRGVRSWDNWRYPYNNWHILSTAYDGNIYLKCWMWEDNDIPFPGPSSEFWPNGYISLSNAAWITNPEAEGADGFSIGVVGEIGRANGNIRDFFDNCCVYSASDYYQALNGDGVPAVPRKQGWRSYTILVKPYTGNPGDVQFFIDDTLVYEGLRKQGTSFDNIILGTKWWTHETYYYDQVQFGTVETPFECAKISDALARPDETWVDLQSKIVVASFTYGPDTTYDKPWPGYLAIEESDGSSALWISSSYPAAVVPASNLGERISVKGIMRTNEAGMRYLDAIQITHIADPVGQPAIVGTPLKNLDSPLVDGKLVKVWGKVVNVPGSSPATVKGQERPGDWRRYFLIDDGSPGGPVKCYYNNIIVPKPGTDPAPAVSNGDYVSVVGVAGREVLVPGTTGAEKSVWIRGAGDLQIQHDVP